MATGLHFVGLPWHISLRVWLLLLCVELDCDSPLLDHAIGETTAKANQDIPIRSAGMTSTSTHETKSGPRCDCMYRFPWLCP